MMGDLNCIYSDPSLLYKFENIQSLKFRRQAAIEICNTAANGGFFVIRWEGGIWHSARFEARLDSICDSQLRIRYKPYPISFRDIDSNNYRVAGII